MLYIIRHVEGQSGPPVNLPLRIFVVVYHVPSEINSGCIVSVSRNINKSSQYTILLRKNTEIHSIRVWFSHIVSKLV